MSIGGGIFLFCRCFVLEREAILMCNIHCLGCCRGVSGDKAILFWSAPLVVGLRAKDRSLNQIYLVY